MQKAKHTPGLTITALLLAVTLSGCASIAPRASVGHVAYVGSAVADIATSQAAFNRGAIELNPLLGESPNVARMAALKIGGFGLLRLLETTIENEIGRQLNWYEQILFWLVPTAIQTWAAIHNHRTAR